MLHHCVNKFFDFSFSAAKKHWILIYYHDLHSVEKRRILFHSQRGNYGNLLSHLTNKNFVKVTFLLKKILKSRFDEFFWITVNFLFLHTVCCGILCIFMTKISWKRRYYYLKLVSRNIFSVLVISALYCTVWELISRNIFTLFFSLSVSKISNLTFFSFEITACLLLSVILV